MRIATADTIPFPAVQPTPLAVSVNRERRADGTCDTVVARLWARQDIGRCRLCPLAACRVDGFGLCLVRYFEDVPDELAALHPFGGLAGAPARVHRMAD